MLNIQELGIQLLGDNPGHFYILGGCEYGIKRKYIDILEAKYGKKVECPTVKEVIDMLSKKHIIPLEPAVYVIRYDETFLSELSDKVVSTVQHLKFVGTIICLYEQAKHITKLDKYFPDNLACIDSVSPQFVSKYLHSDFPKLNDRFIDIAVHHSDNYNQANNMCRCMNSVHPEDLYHMNDDEIASLFGCADVSTEAQIRKGVASKNFKYLVDVLDKYDDTADNVIYAILQTMIEMDKLKDNKYTQSDVQEYAKIWTREDIYYMFMHSYNELKKLRSSSSYDSKLSLIYLFSLLNFQRIPDLEVVT